MPGQAGFVKCPWQSYTNGLAVPRVLAELTPSRPTEFVYSHSKVQETSSDSFYVKSYNFQLSCIKNSQIQIRDNLKSWANRMSKQILFENTISYFETRECLTDEISLKYSFWGLGNLYIYTINVFGYICYIGCQWKWRHLSTPLC